MRNSSSHVRTPDDHEGSGSPRPTRRTALTLALGSGAAAFGIGGAVRQASAATVTATGTVTTDGVRRFVSTSVTMPQLSVQRHGRTAAGKLFVNALGDDGMWGLILDDDGEPFWIKDDDVPLVNLQAHRLDDQPVLAYIDGKTDRAIHVLDDSYAEVAKHSTLADGDGIDSHELFFTDTGTALVIAQVPTACDLRSIDGPKDGWILDAHVYEVDLDTGEATRRWVASQDIAVSETYHAIDDDKEQDGSSKAKYFDPYHVNSVQLYDGSLLISARATHALYSVDHSTGRLEWRMNGRRSDFTVTEDASFAWQHDARWRSDSELTLFDNHVLTADEDGSSCGKVLTVDRSKRTVRLAHQYARSGVTATYAGGMSLAGDHVVVGFGSGDHVTEFTRDGRMVLDMSGFGASTYRAYRQAWVGRPDTDPDVAARTSSSGDMIVYASWNGATEVARWDVLAGTSSSTLKKVGSMTRSGFESHTTVPKAARVAVRARDARGRVLGTSGTVQPS